MKKRFKHSIFLIVLVSLIALLILPSCEMIGSNNFFGAAANGAALPASMAIASGNPKLMWDCFLGLNDKLDNGDLSAFEKGQVALDMVDLLAVLSQALKVLVPYLIENQNLSDFDEIIDALEDQYLPLIHIDDLMSDVPSGEASPLQYLWAILGYLAYMDFTYGWADFDDWVISDDDYNQTLEWINAAQLQATESGNTEALQFFDEFEDLFDDVAHIP